jgi:hypothetical protein
MNFYSLKISSNSEKIKIYLQHNCLSQVYVTTVYRKFSRKRYIYEYLIIQYLMIFVGTLS